MNIEEIKKASDEYIGHPFEVDEDLSITMSRKAFIDGANWYKKSIHEKWKERSIQVTHNKH